jgi:hypothetical protein
LTTIIIAYRIIEFFPWRITSFCEDESVKNYRFISSSYEFFEPADGEVARVPKRESVPQQVFFVL